MTLLGLSISTRWFSKRRARSVLCFWFALFLLSLFPLIYSLWVFNGFLIRGRDPLIICSFYVGEEGNDSLMVEI